MTRIASRHSGRRTSPASRRSRLKSDIEVHYCISRFTMQEQILQLSSTIKPGGATSPLTATPTRNRIKRQNQAVRKSHDSPTGSAHLKADPGITDFLGWHRLGPQRVLQDGSPLQRPIRGFLRAKAMPEMPPRRNRPRLLYRPPVHR